MYIVHCARYKTTTSFVLRSDIWVIFRLCDYHWWTRMNVFIATDIQCRPSEIRTSKQLARERIAETAVKWKCSHTHAVALTIRGTFYSKCYSFGRKGERVVATEVVRVRKKIGSTEIGEIEQALVWRETSEDDAFNLNNPNHLRQEIRNTESEMEDHAVSPHYR